MDLKSQKLGFLARDKLRLSKKDIWCMFEHFFPLILPIFVGQTPKYSVVCFETDCAKCAQGVDTVKKQIVKFLMKYIC